MSCFMQYELTWLEEILLLEALGQALLLLGQNTAHFKYKIT